VLNYSQGLAFLRLTACKLVNFSQITVSASLPIFLTRSYLTGGLLLNFAHL